MQANHVAPSYLTRSITRSLGAELTASSLIMMISSPGISLPSDGPPANAPKHNHYKTAAFSIHLCDWCNLTTFCSLAFAPSHVNRNVQQGFFTWRDWANHHRFLAACYKSKAKHRVASHVHLSGGWWHELVPVQANLLQRAALGDVADGEEEQSDQCMCFDRSVDCDVTANQTCQ